MKHGSLLLALLLIQDAPCAHPARGAGVPVDLDLVARVHRDAKGAFRVAVEKAKFDDPLAGAFDSGLPACRRSGERSVRVDPLPRELVGKILRFGPVKGGDVWIVTRARRLSEAAGGVLASPELARRLGVRCAPATATVKSGTEVVVAEE